MNILIPAIVACINLLYLPHGIIDQIENDVALVEVVSPDGDLEFFTVSIDSFPCSIQEGDYFHYRCEGDFVELTCGKKSASD